MIRSSLFAQSGVLFRPVIRPPLPDPRRAMSAAARKRRDHATKHRGQPPRQPVVVVRPSAPLPMPTEALPGTPEKLAVLIERAAKRQPLFLPGEPGAFGSLDRTPRVFSGERLERPGRVGDDLKLFLRGWVG